MTAGVVSVTTQVLWGVTAMALALQWMRNRAKRQEDAWWLDLAESKRGAKRVACVIPVGSSYVIGTSCDAERSTCSDDAERVALGKCEKTIKVIYVSSLDSDYSPKLETVEALLGSPLTTRETRIQTKSQNATLDELLPYSHADWTPRDFEKRGQDVKEIPKPFALLTGKARDLAFRCYEAASIKCCVTDDVRFGVAVLFDDGTMKSCHQWIHGRTRVDPVALIAPALEKPSRFLILAVVDNYGVAHAPFALARAILADFRILHKTVVCVHDDNDFHLRLVPATDLLFDPPEISSPCTPRSFINGPPPPPKSKKNTPGLPPRPPAPQSHRSRAPARPTFGASHRRVAPKQPCQ